MDSRALPVPGELALRAAPLTIEAVIARGAVRMKVPLKLNAIDQEHLQELYNSAGVARDELPYTPAFDGLVQGFQDRTFKNADAEQMFGALLKYTRSSKNAATEQPPSSLDEDQLKR